MPSERFVPAASSWSMALVSSFEGFIFDYGGVLALHQTESDQARMAKVAGMPLELFSERYWSEREEYDKGVIDYLEYWAAVGRNGGKTLGQSQIDELVEMDSESWMRFDDPMWEWLEQLRSAGKRIAMLSNMPRELGETLKTRTERLDHFDQVTLSYEVHSIKPEPAIYEHALEGIGTAPQQTLFLDDRIANVQGAELLGIRGMQFTNSEEMLLRLKT